MRSSATSSLVEASPASLSIRREYGEPLRLRNVASRPDYEVPTKAQKARWAKARKESQPVVAITKTTASVPVKHTMSASARRKIAAFQRARWAKLKAGKKAA
jgi:hypothetical protein